MSKAAEERYMIFK